MASQPSTPTRKPILKVASSSSSSSPTSSPQPSPTAHTYTSLSSLRRAEAEAARAKLNDGSPRDRKNGFHLWTVEEQARRDGAGGGHDVERQGGPRSSTPLDESKQIGRKRMTQWQLVKLTSGMAGAQICWALEQAFGTPELISLGLSPELTSLVWLAGPLSGLIVQPLIGAISDSDTSKYRRRYWIVLSTGLMIISCLMLAFARPLGEIATSFRGVGEGDWDPKWRQSSKNFAIGVAVLAFYGLDFSVNALQASLRNLLMDVTPAEQLNEGNAWIGRQTHLGSILGFTLGFLDLSTFAPLAWLGGSNFRKFCVLIIIILSGSVWTTCASTEEEEREPVFGVRAGRLRDIGSNILKAIVHLPRPIRRVCYVQLFAFSSWFPFLFYSTTWVGEVMKNEALRDGKPFDPDTAARTGSLAMLLYSFVAIAAGTALPFLAERDRRLLAPESAEHDGDESLTDDDKEFIRIKAMVEEWRIEAKREDKSLKLPILPFMLRNIWTSALVGFFILMAATFLVSRVWQAMVVVALVGACWAVAAWVPFSLVMEYLKEMQDLASADQERAHSGASSGPVASSSSTQGPSSTSRPSGLHTRAASTPGRMWAQARQSSMAVVPTTERTALLQRRHSMVDTTELDDDEDRMKSEGMVGPVAGGTVLGILNLSVVAPQFFVAIIASLIFKAVDAGGHGVPDSPQTGEGAGSGTAWVLRFGGLCALIAAAVTRRVPPTRTEKAMRLRLVAMQVAQEEHEE